MGTPQNTRLKKLNDWLAKTALDGLLVSHLPNIRYLCGFTGSAAALLVAGEHSVLFTDGRYRIQASEEVSGARVRIVRGDPLGKAVGWVAERKLRRVGFESARVSVAGKATVLRSSRNTVRWRGVENCVESLRALKDAQEIEAMRAAARLGSDVFRGVIPLVKPGVREIELAAEIEYGMRSRGASGPAFETIVAFGERTALPHARPTDRRLGKNELVLMDWGAILRGYCCDLTRTIYVGRAPARIRHWHQAVLDAQAAAREVLRPGAVAASVDGAARRVLRNRRLARYFMHSTGHGLGLEVHEAPRLGRNQKDRIQAGNVVTLEPGVYVEGVGGIRIEDDVLVTSGGFEVLTSASREFIQL